MAPRQLAAGGSVPGAAQIQALSVLYMDGKLGQAERKARQLIRLRPRHPFAWKVLGAVLDRLGRPADAIAAKRQAVLLAPGDGEALQNLGNAWMKQERFADAEQCYRQAVALLPDFAEAHRTLGNALLSQGHAEQAETCYLRALALDPRDAHAHNKLGTALREQGRQQEAPAHFRMALALDSKFAAAHNNLGVALHEQGAPAEAEAHLRLALDNDPGLAMAHSNLGLVLNDQGRLDEALLQCRRALALEPANAALHSNLLFSLLHDGTLEPAALAAEHAQFSARFETPLRAAWQAHANGREPERRLRVGFVSGDLRRHAVAHFIEPVWAALDPAVLELWVYSTHRDEDAVTARLRACAAHWRPVAGLSDAALAQQIRADGIDILIDLSGHTAHNRLLTFARKPAPVQASWIGYPGTTGLAAIDYLICDTFNAPHGLYERYYTEQFARLPSGAAFAPSELAPPVNPLPALRNGYLTFGSFNRPSKLGDTVIAAWSRVLAAVPRSRLLLGNVNDGALAASLARRFAGHGIVPERLDFRATLPLARYLALHHEVDFLLDTWPYSGGTTTNHALWMGVPTVTLRGPSCAHCHSAAGLARLGLDAWIADDVDAFVRIAVGWAGRPAELAQLRAGMRARWAGTPWRKHAVIARGLEMALRTMWRRWCAGLPVEHFEVPAGPVLASVADA